MCVRRALPPTLTVAGTAVEGVTRARPDVGKGSGAKGAAARRGHTGQEPLTEPASRHWVVAPGGGRVLDSRP